MCPLSEMFASTVSYNAVPLSTRSWVARPEIDKPAVFKAGEFAVNLLVGRAPVKADTGWLQSSLIGGAGPCGRFKKCAMMLCGSTMRALFCT